MKKFYFIFFIFLFCGYSFHSLLPSYIKKVEITTIENKTTRAFIQEYLRDDLTQAFMKKGFDIVAYKGDMSFEVIITRFSKDPNYYDANQNVYRWKIEISANVKCIDEVKGTTLWESNISRISIYSSEEEEEENVKKVIKEMTNTIVERSLAAW